MAQLDILKMLITGTDLARYKDNDELLNYALSYAESEILKRSGSDSLGNEYLVNQTEGAVYWLSRIGAEGAQSVGENGVSITWQEVPDWLRSVVPRIGVVR
ncbi:hypothetical protein [Caproiciproducens sp.]|uniref:hypothetical protein n=1 Tax=Caproiciproducens sp. TaxID=1954376 RepID=UPI00289EE2C0|nr:hypothetical protein [Caproiciproducens sp.]